MQYLTFSRIFTDTPMLDIHGPNLSPLSCARECLAWRTYYTYAGVQGGNTVGKISFFTLQLFNLAVYLLTVLLRNICPRVKPTDLWVRVQHNLQRGQHLQVWSCLEDEHIQDSGICMWVHSELLSVSNRGGVRNWTVQCIQAKKNKTWFQKGPNKFWDFPFKVPYIVPFYNTLSNLKKSFSQC